MSEKYGDKPLSGKIEKPTKQARAEVVLGNDFNEKAEKLKNLNERLGKEVGNEFRCILNKSGYYNIMYKGDDLKIDIKQEDGVINLSKNIKELLGQIKKEGLDGNKIYSDGFSVWINTYGGITEEKLTSGIEILKNSGYTKRGGITEINGVLHGNNPLEVTEIERKIKIVSDLMASFLNKVNKSK